MWGSRLGTQSLRAHVRAARLGSEPPAASQGPGGAAKATPTRRASTCEPTNAPARGKSPDQKEGRDRARAGLTDGGAWTPGWPGSVAGRPQPRGRGAGGGGSSQFVTSLELMFLARLERSLGDASEETHHPRRSAGLG